MERIKIREINTAFGDISVEHTSLDIDYDKDRYYADDVFTRDDEPDERIIKDMGYQALYINSATIMDKTAMIIFLNREGNLTKIIADKELISGITTAESEYISLDQLLQDDNCIKHGMGFCICDEGIGIYDTETYHGKCLDCDEDNRTCGNFNKLDDSFKMLVSNKYLISIGDCGGCVKIQIK